MSTERETILRGLEDAPAVLAGLVESMSEDELHRLRHEGAWTIAQHVAHLAEVDPIMFARFERMLAEDEPEFVSFVPDDDGQDEADAPSVAESLAAFTAARKNLVALLRGMSDEDWTRKAVHPDYDRYGVRILARHLLMHDHWHMYRMEGLWIARDEYLMRGDG